MWSGSSGEAKRLSSMINSARDCSGSVLVRNSGGGAVDDDDVVAVHEFEEQVDSARLFQAGLASRRTEVGRNQTPNIKGGGQQGMDDRN